MHMHMHMHLHIHIHSHVHIHIQYTYTYKYTYTYIVCRRRTLSRRALRVVVFSIYKYNAYLSLYTKLISASIQCFFKRRIHKSLPTLQGSQTWKKADQCCKFSNLRCQLFCRCTAYAVRLDLQSYSIRQQHTCSPKWSMHVYMHTYVRKCIHTHTHTYIHIYMHACINLSIYLPTYINTHIHTNIHEFIHKYAYLHIHTHTYAWGFNHVRQADL